MTDETPENHDRGADFGENGDLPQLSANSRQPIKDGSATCSKGVVTRRVREVPVNKGATIVPAMNSSIH
jgi:hypothetical protein